ncbi:erythromycin esterase family protein [Microvirga sp. STR05]|uniref:Erythromycin esterase family protein n=1 Tax=Hymenobacter duratus TaxID=2771356 RepID=A0ABR8JFZ8_9BACT|nr:erythromycin esterase family protein [Hymenobacter duratus]MBD2714325.1 erythromycin esterase family protein [Hymenobacter duratus]MBR7949228.1 erythromycin esterase family protein [Microvirga sp. STR05]
MPNSLYRLFFVVLTLLSCRPATAQAILNLDFEPTANRRQPLLFWGRRQQPDELLIRVDTVAPAQHGRGSLLLDASLAEEPEGTSVVTTLPVSDSVSGRIATVSVWVRTEEFQGTAWLKAYSSYSTETTPYSGQLSEKAMQPTKLAPTAGWQKLEVQLPVSQTANRLSMLLAFNGRGRLWLDNFQVRYDKGQTYRDAPLAGTEPLLLPPGTPLPNWDFERRGPAQLPGAASTARRWQLDSAVAQRGRRSLRVEAAPASAAPVYLGLVPLDSLLGKTLTVRGYVRYAGSAVAGQAPPTLLYRVMGNSDLRMYPYDRHKWPGTLTASPLPEPAPGTPWQRFELTLPISAKRNLSQLALLLQPGAAPVWFDHIELLADGRAFSPPPPPVPGLPTAAELAWLRKAAVPLRTTAPDGGDQKDLAAFGQLVGSAPVIGLGEVTLGSHEQMQLKHRLFRYLVEQKNVRVLALDTDLGACLALNDYLQTGTGNPQQLVANLPLWDTEEMLALVRWMRTYNQQHPTATLQLLGIDLQEAPEILRYLRQRLPAQAGYRGELLTTLQRQLRALADAGISLNYLQNAQQTDPRLETVRRLLAEVRAAFDGPAKLRRGYGATPAEAAALSQLLRQAEQYSVVQTMSSRFRFSYRAACLAENVEWARTQANGKGVAVWSHNTHLKTYDQDDTTLGEVLRRYYGAGYVAVGLLFHEGSFRALPSTEPPAFVTATAAPSSVGSYEHYFRAATLPASFLNLRTPDLAPGTQWLYENLLFRDGTLRPYEQPFSRHSLRREFDALLYVPKSTPAVVVRASK